MASDDMMAKHEWAHQQLRVLQEHVAAFLRDRPYRITEELSDDGREHYFRAVDVQPVPMDIRLRVGDIVHNARATLDHLAYRLAVSPTKKTGFPILTRPRSDGSPPTLAGGVSCPGVLNVLDAVQPYRRFPDDPPRSLLAILNRLDITDKHKLINVAVVAFDGARHGIEEVGRDEATLAYDWGPLEDGKVLATVRFNQPNTTLHPDLDVTPVVAIRDEPVLTGEESVVQLLFRILQEVAETRNAFRALV